MWKTTFRSVNVTNMLRIKVKICVTAMNNPQNHHLPKCYESFLAYISFKSR